MHYKEGRESGKNKDIFERFSLKLFRFGLLMFFFAFLFGGWLWFKFGIGGTWLNVKLGLVALLFFYFIFRVGYFYVLSDKTSFRVILFCAYLTNRRCY